MTTAPINGPDPPTIEAFRLRLKSADFSPVPLNGKIPPGKGWQRLGDATDHEIRRWSRTHSACANTGVLTRRTPALDIDVLDPEAAEAVERLARERFEDAGRILTRFGRAPKRAVIFRTDAPFEKIETKLIAPNGEPGQRLELLCDGQQIAVAGIHPEIGEPYSWRGGVPGDVKREELPAIGEKEARALVKAAVELLVTRFGYRQAAKTKPEPKSPTAGTNSRQTDWSCDFSDHDQVARLAMSLLKTGMNDGAAVNYLRAQVEGLANIDPGRRARRLKEIPDMVSSARAKLDAEAAPSPVAPPPSTLDRVIGTFQKWLKLDNPNPVYAVLGTVAANRLPGDPVWLGIVAAPSSAKTEILNALSQLPDVEAVATLSMPALLSGTSKRDTAAGAKGGLLRKLGDFGILALKDFGSILSMRAEARAELLAGLREIYDGSWTRHVGVDGGKTLTWKGKIGLIFCATQAFDDERALIASLGDRFIVCRLSPAGGGQLKKALEHTGAAFKTMRGELAAAVAGLFASVAGREPSPIADHEIARLENVVSLAVRLRGHVQRDRYSREIESIHDPEGQARIGLSLERLLAGLDVIGLERGAALRLTEAIALDSTPPVRRQAFEILSAEAKTTREIARALKLPTTTARRALQDLAAQGLALRSRAAKGKKKQNEKKPDQDEEKSGGADLWTRDPNAPEIAERSELSPNPAIYENFPAKSLNGEKENLIDPSSYPCEIKRESFSAPPSGRANVAGAESRPSASAEAETSPRTDTGIGGMPSAGGTVLPADQAYAAALEMAVGFDLAPEGDAFGIRWPSPPPSLNGLAERLNIVISGMPSMVTRRTKAALRAFGFSPEAISQMTPIEALKAVRIYELITRSLRHHYDAVCARLRQEAGS